jgi:hypothetical protein
MRTAFKSESSLVTRPNDGASHEGSCSLRCLVRSLFGCVAVRAPGARASSIPLASGFTLSAAWRRCFGVVRVR